MRLVASGLALLIALSGCAQRNTELVPVPTRTPISTQALVPHDGKALVGVQLAWEEQDTPEEYVRRSGLRPAQYGEFLYYPLTEQLTSNLTSMVDKSAAQSGNFFLTLMPMEGLASVNEENARATALTLASLNKTGVKFYVRFAHEMNGSWYPYGQQPEDYKRAFRIVADAVRQYAPGNAMVWSPNYGGGGYPFPNAPYSVKPGTADFVALDTNADGRLSIRDDPYSPYYPGDQYVDWVGLTLYWWGFAWPWEDNEVPDQRFAAAIKGAYQGTDDETNERDLPNFYKVYAADKNKPMALSETAALYNTESPVGDSELAIKTAWIKQVFAKGNASQFPQLKMINWFEHQKKEIGTPVLIDWRVTHDRAVLAQYKRYTTQPQFLFAPL